MAGLYPPYIEGTLPAFCLDENGNGDLNIPFSINQAVSRSEVNGISVKFKSVQNDVLLTSCIADSYNNDIATIKVVDYQKTKDLTFAIGQYYKVQLAFINNGNIGYYSTVGVIKCTSKPSISIEGLDDKKVNNNNNQFIGNFVQPKNGDVTEKVYSSYFVVEDKNYNIVYKTEEMLHSVEDDPNSYTAYDKMIFNRDIDPSEIYTIRYHVTTTNGLELDSPKYLLIQPKSLNSSLNCTLVPTLNFEEGYVDLSLRGEGNANGMFVLSRMNVSEPNVWDELYQFSLNYESPNKTIFTDFTVEQGRTYVYSIQQYNSYGVYSDRLRSKEIYVNFEDTFLFDGERQLKLRFNPQVSNFKTQLSETKVDTIGSKYPTFFRNAAIGYKTFPIGGLISMHTDDAELFTTFESILRERDKQDRSRTTTGSKGIYYENETSPNATTKASERLFKLQVLDWMDNGKVKLFRSPTEGNYLVRCMENSLGANDTLGRMLHTLTSTAYETADNTYDNLVKYGIIRTHTSEEIMNNTGIPQWREKSLVGTTIIGPSSGNLLQVDKKSFVTNVKIEDLLPGTKVRLAFDRNNTNVLDITIGATGNYYADNVDPIYGIYVLNPYQTIDYPIQSGTISYQYEEPEIKDAFNSIKSIETDITPYRQFNGPVEDNLLRSFDTTKEKATHVSMVELRKKPLEYIYFYGVSKNFFKDGNNIYDSGIIGNRSKSSTLGSHELYWDIDAKELFSEKESREYSPFSMYIVRDLNFEGNGVPSDHTFNPSSNTDNTTSGHSDSHLFERYYLDRMISATTPEEYLLNYYETSKEYQEAHPLFLIDAFSGQIYQINKDNRYDPSFVLNGERISLENYDRYSLDNIDLDKDTLIINNGLYGEVFYHSVITNYSFENDEKPLYKQNEKTLKNVIKSSNNTDSIQQYFNRYEESLKEYNDTLAKDIDEWSERK